MGAKEEKLMEFHDNMRERLGQQVECFVNTVAPYLTVSCNGVKECIDSDSASSLNGFSFFRLRSCTTENVDDIDAFLSEKFAKLFVALHALGETIVYGVISRNGKANIVIGVRKISDSQIIRSMIEGLLVGVDVEDFKEDFSKPLSEKSKGGFISAVPVLKVDEEKQRFDLSTLMRSLSGKDYMLLVYAKPLANVTVQNKYNQTIEIRDVCAMVSKRGISNQTGKNISSRTVTEMESRRKFFPELLNQVVREGKLNGRQLLDSILDGGIKSTSTTEDKKDESFSSSVSLDIQNGFAMEMQTFCDKAIERLKYGQGIGFWNVTITYAASDEVKKILESCICAEIAKPSADLLPVKIVSYDLAENQSIYLPKNEKGDCLCAPITSEELGMLCTPPSAAVPNFEMKEGISYPMIPSDGSVVVGHVADGHKVLDNIPFALSNADLNKHTFVCGITGSGKTTTVKGILKKCGKPFMVIESAKKEYRSMECKLEVYTLGKPEINCLQCNPFYVQKGINLQMHIDFLKDLFNASFSFYGPMPYILERCLHNIYKKKGWNVTFGYHPYLVNLSNKAELFDSKYMETQHEKVASKYIFPTMQDLKDEVKRYIEQEMQYDSEIGGNIKTAILARLESLCVGAKGYMFNTHEKIDMAELMKKNVVFELEGLADDSDKAFCVGLLVIFINEYRQIAKDEGKSEGLEHLLVIEEAHRLLKNVETERTSENMGNPKGKAVEHFTNMIAEMRSYGQGVIIAEQIPSKLAPDVIKNSSNKIIQRVVSADDQELVANTIGIKTENAVYLGNLETGYALCHKEGMSLPVHVKVEPVRENKMSDSQLMKNVNVNDIFRGINHQIICENISAMPDEAWECKLMNSILLSDKNLAEKCIQHCKRMMINALPERKDSLLPIGNDDDISELCGEVLAERLIALLCNGIYSNSRMLDKEKLVGDKLCDDLIAFCKKPQEEHMRNLSEKLEKFYGRKPENHCIRVVSEMLKAGKNKNKNGNLDVSVKYFFFDVSDDVRNKILEKTRSKGGAENDANGVCIEKSN